jgi:hypothetical protein
VKREGHAPGDHERSSREECGQRVRAGVVGVDQIRRARGARNCCRSRRLRFEALCLCGGRERRFRRGEQRDVMPGLRQALHQKERLPLPAAHLAPGIDVQDSHG